MQRPCLERLPARRESQRPFLPLQRLHPRPRDTGPQLAASGRGGSSRGASRRQHICPEPALRGTAWPVGAAVRFTYAGRRISVLPEVKARAFGPYVLRTDGRTDGDRFLCSTAREGGGVVRIASESKHIRVFSRDDD